MLENLLVSLDLTWPELLGVTIVIFGFAANAMGKAVAGKWQPVIYCFGYAVLLGFFDRFIIYALFDGPLLSWSAYLIDTGIILLISLVAHRLTMVRKMIKQYPWLYQRSAVFFWKEKV